MDGMLPHFASAGAADLLIGRDPLLLDAPTNVWLVAAGTVDVFVAAVRDGRPATAGTHLFQAGPGDLLLGVGTDGGYGFVAVGGLDAQVCCLHRDRLTALPSDTAAAGWFLDAWIRRVTDGVNHSRSPRRFVPLEAGVSTYLETEMTVGPSREVVWVKLVNGEMAFLGADEFSLTPADGWFPVGGGGWLMARGEVSLRTADTTSLLSDSALWAGLDRFHRIAREAAARNARADIAVEWDRLRRKVTGEDRLLEQTLARFTAVTEVGLSDGEEPEAAESALLAAFRLIGNRLGIEVRAPVGWGERGRWADPVGAIARASRVRVRRVLLTNDWWRQDNGPLLAFRSAPVPDKTPGDAHSPGEAPPEDQPIALLPVSPSRYELVDPPTGLRSVVTADEAARLRPFGYTFYRPFPDRAVSRSRLLTFALAGGWRDWIVVLGLGLVTGLLGLLTPIATGWLFGRVIPDQDAGQLLLLILVLAVTAVSTTVFGLVRGIAGLRLETRMGAAVEAAVWDRLLNLPVPFFRQYSAGDLAARAGGIGAVRQLLSDVFLSSLLTLTFALFSFGLLLYYDARLASLGFALFAVVVVVTAGVSWVQLRYERQVSDLRGTLTGLLLQLLTGISRLRVAGVEGRALAVWARLFSRQRRLEFRAASMGNYLAAFYAAIPALALLTVFASITLLPPEVASIGLVLAFQTALFQILMAAVATGSDLAAVMRTVPLYERARPILETPPEVDPGKTDPGDLSGEIEVNGVSFRYRPDGPPVLSDVSLHIRPGEFVALVGPSGAGKSTLMRILLGFEPPSSGSVYYDRADLATLNLQALRRQIGVVLQNGKLTPGDIFTNIVGSSFLTLDDAWAAARVAGLDEDIQAMPMGMFTVVTEGECPLSGGQRQRLVIARAVAARPRILFFDEATSALDNETQAKVRVGLENLKATRIAVAHRLSTIVNADRIYVFDGGRVVQEGTYAELMARPGLFAELARRQVL